MNCSFKVLKLNHISTVVILDVLELYGRTLGRIRSKKGVRT